MDLHALHILPAYIQNEAHLRKELPCSLIVSHRFYLSGVYFICSLNKAFTVSGHDRSAYKRFLRQRCVDLFEDLLNDCKRIALIVAVMLIQELFVSIDNSSLRSGRSCIYTQENSSLGFGKISSFYRVFRVASSEFGKFFIVVEKRSQIFCVRDLIRRSILKLRDQRIEFNSFLIVSQIRSSDGNEEFGVIREDYVFIFKIKSLYEPLPELGKVFKRTSEECYLAPDRMTAGQA